MVLRMVSALWGLCNFLGNHGAHFASCAQPWLGAESATADQASQGTGFKVQGWGGLGQPGATQGSSWCLFFASRSCLGSPSAFPSGLSSSGVTLMCRLGEELTDGQPTLGS